MDGRWTINNASAKQKGPEEKSGEMKIMDQGILSGWSVAEDAKRDVERDGQHRGKGKTQALQDMAAGPHPLMEAAGGVVAKSTHHQSVARRVKKNIRKRNEQSREPKSGIKTVKESRKSVEQQSWTPRKD